MCHARVARRRVPCNCIRQRTARRDMWVRRQLLKQRRPPKGLASSRLSSGRQLMAWQALAGLVGSTLCGLAVPPRTADWMSSSLPCDVMRACGATGTCERSGSAAPRPRWPCAMSWCSTHMWSQGQVRGPVMACTGTHPQPGPPYLPAAPLRAAGPLACGPVVDGVAAEARWGVAGPGGVVGASTQAPGRATSKPRSFLGICPSHVAPPPGTWHATTCRDGSLTPGPHPPTPSRATMQTVRKSRIAPLQYELLRELAVVQGRCWVDVLCVCAKNVAPGCG